MPKKKQNDDYDPKKGFSTGDLEAIQLLRVNIKVVKRWSAIIAFVLSLLGILGYRALVNEIKSVVSPVEKKVVEMEGKINERLGRIEVKQEGTIKRLDKLEDKR